MLLLSACERRPGSIPPQAVKGVLDLSAWDFDRDGIAKLDGEWEFYWEHLLTPQDFVRHSHLPPPSFFSLPKPWTGHTIEAGPPLPGAGYATFRLTAHLPDSVNASVPKTFLAVKIQEMTTAYRLWINGDEVASNGTVGTDRETTVPQYLPLIATFHPHNATLDIVLQISNFRHRSGGMWWSLELGTAQDIMQKRERQIAFALFLFGSLLIMALYHIGLYWFRPKDPSTLWFSGCTLLIAIRTILAGDYYLITLLPDIPWTLHARVEYMTVYLFAPLFAMFLQQLYPQEFSQRMLRFSQWTGIAFSVFVSLAPAPLFTHSFTLFEKLTVVYFSYPVYALIRAVFRKREGAPAFLGGFLMLGFTAVNDMLHNHHIIHTGFYVPLGLFLFILVQSYILAQRFSKAFGTNEELADELRYVNQHLEQLVAERTQELSTSNTQLEQAKENAQKAQWAAESANQAKSRFLANMSHELRTPMNAILGFAQILVKDPQMPDAGKYLATIHRSGQHLLALINQVLDLSKIEAERMETDLADVDLHGLLEDIRSLFMLKAEKKQINLSVACDGDVPPVILTDEVKLRQVLINLVGNAVKFTRYGSVNVRVWVSSRIVGSPNSSALRLIFGVEDTGPGIAPEELDKLFVAFTQTSAGQASHEGTGLGLTLSRKLVHLLGGDIRVRSEVGQGSAFTFAIQAEASDRKATRPECDEPVEYANGKPTIPTLTPDMFTTIPLDTVKQFEHAVDAIDMAALPGIIEEIRTHDTQLAQTLHELVELYRFDILQHVFELNNSSTSSTGNRNGEPGCKDHPSTR